jgi:hypothetical protein
LAFPRPEGADLKLFRDEFEDLGALAVEIVCRCLTLLGLGLYRSRHGFVEKRADGLLAGQYPAFDQGPIERDNRADRRHRVRRVVEWLHFTLSDDCAAAPR